MIARLRQRGAAVSPIAYSSPIYSVATKYSKKYLVRVLSNYLKKYLVRVL